MKCEIKRSIGIFDGFEFDAITVRCKNNKYFSNVSKKGHLDNIQIDLIVCNDFVCLSSSVQYVNRIFSSSLKLFSS